MACSASMLATRLSAARNSKDIECAKYSARLTNPNATHSTMINTDPTWRVGAGLRLCRVGALSFIAILRWLGRLHWCALERQSAQRARPELTALGTGGFHWPRVESGV